MNPKIEELIQVLVDNGMSPDEITKVRDDMLQAVYETFMQDALQSLTDDDLKVIEASPTQDEANVALKRIYQEKTGKDSQEVMKSIVDAKADELIGKYKTATSSADADAAGMTKAQDELHTISNQPSLSTPDVDPAQAAKPANWQ
jgi:hypothetical protein